MLCAAPDYLKKHGTPKTPADLAQHRCLPYAPAPRRATKMALNGPGGEHVIRVTGPLASNNGDMLQCAATDGLGIALLPTFIVGPDLQTGALQTVLPDYTPAELGIYAVYPPNRQLAAKVRAFIDMLVGAFGPAAAVGSGGVGRRIRQPVTTCRSACSRRSRRSGCRCRTG